MSSAESSIETARENTPVESAPRRQSRSARIGLTVLSALLLFLSFAPFNLFFLAWVALVPWLLILADSKSIRAAFVQGFAISLLFFSTSCFWFYTATIPGTIGIILTLSLIWAVAAAAMAPWLKRGSSPMFAVLLVPAIWTASEYFRTIGYLRFGSMLLGQTQSPLPILCQIADCTGILGISFLMMAINVAAMLLWRERRASLPAALTVLVLIAAAIAYGAFRLSQSTLSHGPHVTIVQTNHRYLRGGIPTVTHEQAAQHCFSAIESIGKTDLIILPESVLPPLNPEAREHLQRAPVGAIMQATHEQLAALSLRRAPILTGSHYVGGWTFDGKVHLASDLRNSAYLYSSGAQSSSRYDKIQLVPFAETMPFASSFPWAHDLLLNIAAGSAAKSVTPGAPDAQTVFTLPTGHRFITPICFENLDGPHIAAGLRDKRADFLVNLSNDGWFANIEHAQQFQSILFRAIENRTSIVRCSNTGISGFIDPLGRVGPTLGVGVEASLSATVMLDSRTSFYTRHPHFFGICCMILAVLSIPLAIRKRSCEIRPVPV